MLADFKPMAFLATTDAARARIFYERVLGLRLVSEDDFAVVYDIGGIEFRLQKVRELSPQPHTALGWAVDGISTGSFAASLRKAAGSSASRSFGRTPPASGSRPPAHGSPGSGIPTAICCR